MFNTSIYQKMARLVKVGDVCKPLEILDSEWSGEEVWEVFYITSPHDFGGSDEFDLYKQISLVEQDGIITGYFKCSEEDWEFDEARFVKKNTKLIPPHIIIAADTPLLEAVKLFAEPEPAFYLVIKETEYIGWLSFSALYSMEFKMCLFALLVELEQALLSTCKNCVEKPLEKLSTSRIGNAKSIYKLQGYELDENGNAREDKLLDCTTFSDKIKILQNTLELKKNLPDLDNKFCSEAAKLRNNLAHTFGYRENTILLQRDKLVPFIEWVEKFKNQLRYCPATHRSVMGILAELNRQKAQADMETP